MALLLTGCAATNQTADGDESAPSAPASPTPSRVDADWDPVDESGVGPATLTIPRPSPDAFYLMATFTCSSGDFMVELQEDPRVFMSGTCGGSGSYQMPLPADISALNLTVSIDDVTGFTFAGTFMPKA
ncbi:hypothetical protein [Marisediminicola sp. LYQ134]|uniref:hypothetical protein n=1 Tax=Marisediminicola sp. LYQ134 TaxID=3391061 RepID=UPI00398330FE